MKLYGAVRDTSVSIAMAVLERSISRKRRTFWRPSFRPEALARARPSRVRSEMRSRFTSANSASKVVMSFVWMSCLPSTRRPSRESSLTTSRSPDSRSLVSSWNRRRFSEACQRWSPR